MTRLLLALALGAGMVLLTPGAALACSCVERTTAEQVAAAGTVVDARLTWVADYGVEKRYGIEVGKVFKGKAAEAEKLVGAVNTAECGLGELATDERYLFFVEGEHPGLLKVNLCGGTAPYDATLAAAIEQVTGDPRDPLVYVPPASADGEDSHASTWFIAVIGVAAVAVLGALVVVKRRG